MAPGVIEEAGGLFGPSKNGRPVLWWRMSLAWRVLTIVVAIWAVAAGVIFFVRQSEPTPEKIVAYVQEHPLEGSGDRAKVIEAVANRLNGLDFEDRQRLQRSREMRGFYEAMMEEEQRRFLDLTLPEGFRQVMLALNKMTPEKRKEIVERALNNIAENGSVNDERPPVDEEMMRKIVGQGMTAFYEEANADVKLDFAPVIEQIQQSLQWR